MIVISCVVDGLGKTHNASSQCLFFVADIIFLVFVWHVRTVKLLMISGASRSPLMTAFAELIQRADPPSVPYHRVSGLRGRNPLWYTPIALHLLLFSLKGKYKVEFRDSKNPRACTAQNSRQIRISVLYKLTFILHDLLVSVMSFCLHFFCINCRFPPLLLKSKQSDLLRSLSYQMI